MKQHLEINKKQLVGQWIKNNSSYDGYICDILDMTENTGSYWDAVWHKQQIEFKKGHSIWFEKVNGDFEWIRMNTKLTITVTHHDSTIKQFEFQMSDLKNNSMIFETPKGYKYFLEKIN